jgi:hypothetical protein
MIVYSALCSCCGCVVLATSPLKEALSVLAGKVAAGQCFIVCRPDGETALCLGENVRDDDVVSAKEAEMWLIHGEGPQ